MRPISRRDFLKIATRSLLAGSGILGLGMFARLLGYQSESPLPTEFDLGPSDKYPVGSRTVLAEIPAVLIHDAAGFSALSLVCTHLGCTLGSEGEEFACPCHGSRFTAGGDVLKGPAARRLTALRVELNEAGHVILYNV